MWSYFGNQTTNVEEMILLNKPYAFFSHIHKVQKESMPLLDKISAEKASLFDYELIVGDHGKRLLAKFAGYLSLGYLTPFLSLGASYMYPFLAAAKAAVVGEEIATQGLPSGICLLVFAFTGYWLRALLYVGVTAIF